MLRQSRRLVTSSWSLLSECQSQQASLGQAGILSHVQSLFGQQFFSSQAYSPELVQMSRALDAPPKELTYYRGEHQISAHMDNVAGRLLLQIMGWHSTRSRLIRSAIILYEAVRCQADNPALLEPFALDPAKFFERHVVLMMHMWLVLERLKGTSSDIKYFRQRLYEHFHLDVSRRLAAEGMEVSNARMAKRMENLFYHLCANLNRATASGGGDSAVELALMDEVYGGDSSKRGAAGLMTRYLIREKQCITMTPYDDVVMGQIRFTTEPFLPFGPPFPAED